MAAVAARSSANNSPHLGANGMTASPRSNNKKPAEPQAKDAPAADSKTDVPTINKPADDNKESSTINAPLAPPPKPSQNGEGGDLFGGHGHFSKEPNPFESAFGSNSTETPGKTQLPGVTSLTSPAPLLPGNTPAWPGSLRSGPLSPAMLTGPTGSNDYFNSDHHFGGSFPTPNESSLRTGLTPGGGGSMFPQPSPNSQALYNQLQSGGATPGTLDFHRTAMTARAQTHNNTYGMAANGATSQPNSNPNIQPDLDSKSYNPQPNQQSHDNRDPFSSHQATDATNAASGLFMLAQAGGQQRNGSQGFSMGQQQQSYHGGQADNRSAKHNSVDSSSTQPGQNDYSDGSDDAKPQTRSARGGKKSASAGKGGAAGKRKTEDTPSRSNKKQRQDSEEMDEDMMDEETGADGKKMTDEEKRKNFLERNRVAALKCRQRKKQWLANLQQKVEILSSENDALAATVTQLREEIVGLKTLLLAHKDCPVSQAQGISGMAMQQLASDTHPYANPYGMAMGPNGQGQMPQASMQRR